jgi:2-oxo-4-hydroxy-4-carboxy-5-ureidoimidazoline decarboxylase
VSADFVRRFAGVYESSPWVAEEACRGGDPTDPAAAMRAALETAGRDRQLALLRAHPDLAGRLAVAGELTPESSAEQAGAGLDRCTPAEFAEFQDLNARYRAAFGFPFILAVRGHDRAAILAAFRRRVANVPDAEFREALDQVHRIAAFRIADLTGETP